MSNLCTLRVVKFVVLLRGTEGVQFVLNTPYTNMTTMTAVVNPGAAHPEKHALPFCNSTALVK